MSQDRPTPVNDAATQLGVTEAIVEKMISVGQIAVDSHKPTLMVLVRDHGRQANPRYTPIPPLMKQVFKAASVSISGTASSEVADQVLKVLVEIGFFIKEGRRETHITPTAVLSVDTVPQIRERIEAVVGKNTVSVYITAYDLRDTGSLVPYPHG